MNPAEIAHGPMFLGFIFDVLLYGIMILQVHFYFQAYPNDLKWLKILVLGLLLANTLNIVFDSVFLYDTLIRHFGDLEVLGKGNWVFATDPALTGIIATAVQLFFAYRIRVITKTWYLPLLVIFASVLGMIAALATAVLIHFTPEFRHFQDFKHIVIVWLVCSVLADVLITSILVYQLVLPDHFLQL
ncbi:hypothetical protein C8J56DRAFT_1039665 [Mycena floridula]|nr:hypothetical protein C8J56DRAFT_1039665 [Mycena floridula]